MARRDGFKLAAQQRKCAAIVLVVDAVLLSRGMNPRVNEPHGTRELVLQVYRERGAAPVHDHGETCACTVCVLARAYEGSTPESDALAQVVMARRYPRQAAAAQRGAP